MNYIQKIASDIERAVGPDSLPASQNTDSLFLHYAVLLLAKGNNVSIVDIHNAWGAWMSADNPNHPSLVPFGELPENIKQLDEPYLKAVQCVATSLKLNES